MKKDKGFISDRLTEALKKKEEEDNAKSPKMGERASKELTKGTMNTPTDKSDDGYGDIEDSMSDIEKKIRKQVLKSMSKK